MKNFIYRSKFFQRLVEEKRKAGVLENEAVIRDLHIRRYKNSLLYSAIAFLVIVLWELIRKKRNNSSGKH